MPRLHNIHQPRMNPTQPPGHNPHRQRLKLPLRQQLLRQARPVPRELGHLGGDIPDSGDKLEVLAHAGVGELGVGFDVRAEPGDVFSNDGVGDRATL